MLSLQILYLNLASFTKIKFKHICHGCFLYEVKQTAIIVAGNLHEVRKLKWISI